MKKSIKFCDLDLNIDFFNLNKKSLSLLKKSFYFYIIKILLLKFF